MPFYMFRSKSRPGSSSHGKGLSDFGLRRRRSTGSKAAAAAAIAVSASTSSGGTASGSGAGTGGGKARDSVHLQVGVSNVGIPNPPPLPENAPSSSVPGFSAPGPITPVASTSSITTMSSTSKGDRKSQLKPPSNAQDLKFSTADRTILEELKANIQAREAQFKIMGVGHTVVGGGKCAGKKYHPYPKNEVPYPRSYDRLTLGVELAHGCYIAQGLGRSAGRIAECHFVGLDIVPLHPNLQNVGSPDLASRITWVQHNFLEVLPFQNEEFDFVHIKRISLGVPEDKWDKLFEEIHRVMKPGGAFEMIEEDLFFPGRRVVEQDDPSTRDDASSVTRRNSSSDRHRASINSHDEMGRLEHVAENSDPAPQTPATIHATLPAASRPGSPTTIKNGEYPNGRADPLSERKPQAPQTMVIIPPHSRSAARPLLHVKTQPTTGAYTDFVGLGGQMHPAMFGSSVSLLGTMGYLTIQDPLVEMIKESKRSRISAVMAPGLGHASSTSSDGHQPNIQPAAKKTKPSPFLLRSLTQTKAPTNPRDHTILAAVWHGMLGSRFVNPTPLSLLTTFLEYHFKDVRTHPPLLYTFPPVPVRAEEESGDESHGLLHSESESDVDGARDVIVPRPKRPRSTKSRKSLSSNSTSSHANESGEVSEEHRWLSMQALLKHKSPYITLDESRAYAYSPSNKSAFHLQKTNDGKMLLSNRISRLPNTTLHIDLRTLNLHLALRAKEVIACSEPMWHWVEKTQADAKAAAVSPSSSRGSRFRSDSIESTLVGSGSDADSSTTDEDTARNAILEMTRDDFDQLLNNFEMDMQDKASVGNALRERFNWQTFPSPILQDRKAFDLACEKYDNWAEQNKIHQPSVQVVHRSRNSFSNSGLVPPTPDSPDSRDHNLINRITP
ncbi:hypothetical protein NLJ89_g8695 [Agrocybe chaxingu]|uniref:Methyltransferase domain-containing protein n=1 Tax=Agrocybe chaxingu TaxID=84603 RepID=A0A9W8MQJ4_9AGAR|nr:hypothetical protein NLJ89_g8695 [Agrocybe chaxingu]